MSARNDTWVDAAYQKGLCDLMKYNLLLLLLVTNFKKVGHPIVKYAGNTADMNKRKTGLRYDDADVTVSDG